MTCFRIEVRGRAWASMFSETRLPDGAFRKGGGGGGFPMKFVEMISPARSAIRTESQVAKSWTQIKGTTHSIPFTSFRSLSWKEKKKKTARNGARQCLCSQLNGLFACLIIRIF